MPPERRSRPADRRLDPLSVSNGSAVMEVKPRIPAVKARGAADLDLAVIGGGPAGTSAAIAAARRGSRVALFDAGRFPRHKVCGEFVSPESAIVLAELLRASPCERSELKDVPRIEYARLLLGDKTLAARIAPAAWSISRYQLDALLWRTSLESGVEG